MDRSIIENYITGGQTIGKVTAGLTVEQLNWVPPKDAGIGLWSIRQIVVHLSDADAAFADRIKRVIATENPTLLAWDENAYAANLFYEKQSAQDAITLIDVTRRQIGRILVELPQTAFERTAMHTERGPMTLTALLALATTHLLHHLIFVEQKRESMKKA